MALKLTKVRKISNSMKKILLALIISSGFSFIAGAQSKFSIGPNAGVGSSWLDNTPNRKSKQAGNVGLSFVYSAQEHFGIGIDTKYSFEGGKYSTTNETTTVDLNYIRVPLKFMYFFNSYGNKVRPKIFAGPSFGFLAGGDTRIETPAITRTVKSKDYYKSFDFGLTGGLGLNMRLVKNTWFNADVSYLHGITDIRPASKQHNRNIGVNVGVNFGL
jgi:outer membrane protein W